MSTHHTLIDGTAYAISGGSQLQGGTKFQMGGRTQVDGTAYEITFGPKEVILTVVDGWNGSTYYMWVNYNNKYMFSESVVLQAGAKISIIISNADKANCSVYLNGSKVAEAKSFINYEYVLKKDVTVKFTRYSYRADITEG